MSKKSDLVAAKIEFRLRMREQRLLRAIEKANEGNLWSVGYLISQIAKGYIKRSRRPAKPGQPPKTKRGQLRRAIRYKVADDRESVVIGPAFSMVGTVGEAHEYGGEYKGGTFPTRPFIGPALDEALPKIGPQWQGSVN